MLSIRYPGNVVVTEDAEKQRVFIHVSDGTTTEEIVIYTKEFSHVYHAMQETQVRMTNGRFGK